MKLALCGIALAACLDVPNGPILEQVQDGETPELTRCQVAYAEARAVPASGWINQIAIEAYAGLEPSEGNNRALRMLVSKYGLLEHLADPADVNIETVFYAWANVGAKIAVLNALEACK